jgi:hypothetical protein
VAKTWNARGTGPVKTGEIIESSGNTEVITTEELLSFTKG